MPVAELVPATRVAPGEAGVPRTLQTDGTWREDEVPGRSDQTVGQRAGGRWAD